MSDLVFDVFCFVFVFVIFSDIFILFYLFMYIYFIVERIRSKTNKKTFFASTDFTRADYSLLGSRYVKLHSMKASLIFSIFRIRHYQPLWFLSEKTAKAIGPCLTHTTVVALTANYTSAIGMPLAKITCQKLVTLDKLE